MKRAFLAAIFMLSACAVRHSSPPASMPGGNLAGSAAPVQQTSLPASLQNSRISGRIGNQNDLPRPSASYGAAPAPALPAAGPAAAPGNISLDFADTDIRTAVDQILGQMLKQTYTMDPAVQGTVSLHTVTPLSRDALIPTLQTLLAQNNAVLVRTNGIYSVMPADKAANVPSLTGDDALGGAVVVHLKYTDAAPLAAMLQPYISATAKIVASAEQNALIVEGDPVSRQALVSLIEAFDIDELAGQSYELFPVTGGDAQDFAKAFSSALNKSGDASEPAVTVVPLERINAVLVIARNRSMLADAQRVYAVLNQVERETLRSWHVYYLQNGRSNDAAYMLQQAFTPDNVTAQPTPQSSGQVSTTFSNQSGSGGTGTAGTSADIISGGTGGTGGTTDQSGGTAGTGTAGASSSSTTASTGQSGTSGASALLGPLSSGGNSSQTDAIRIIPDNENNSLLIYATAEEDDRIDATLEAIDISPVEVRIDAVIAEVDLTGALQYGTQFYFKSGDINAVLSTATTSALATNFPGFVLSGAGGDAAPLAISALQSVTKVRMLSAPELMVLDGQAASLQVGDLVPYLSQTSQDTTTANSPVISSINYRETGVILRVTPHVGSDGLVTLDLDQEVSGVAPTLTTTGINSPTFTERAVTSRVAIQDGQTVGLAGLISDNDSKQNSGIPFLKNVPLLGNLVSSQDNNRTREELLVLITPHVIRSHQDAADLTLDMQEQLPNAANIPAELQRTPISGSADPDAKLLPP